MEIDLIVTKQKLHATGRTLAGWARCNGFNTGTVASFFSGGFPSTGEVGKAIVKQLDADGFLSYKEAA